MFDLKRSSKKITLITICLLLFFSAIAISIYSNHNSKVEIDQVSVEESSEITAQEFDGFTYEMAFSENQTSKISPMSNIQPLAVDEAPGYYWDDVDGIDETYVIRAGANIFLYKVSQNLFALYVADEDGNNEIKIKELKILNGYKLTLVKANDMELYEVDDEGRAIETTRSAEEVDPNYEGTIIFTVKCDKTTYFITYYTQTQNDNGSFGYTSDNVEYNVMGKDVDDLNLYSKVEGYEATGVADIDFTRNTNDYITTINNEKFCKLTAIDKGSYGNFGATEGNTASDPKIIHIPESTNFEYNLKINSGTLTPNSNFGVAAEGVEGIQSFICLSVGSDSGLKFQVSNVANVFAKFSNDLTEGYQLFNYGYYITGYTITFDEKNLKYESAWGQGNGGLSVDGNTDITSITFGKLIEFVNSISIGAGTNVVEITPNWSPIKINVKNGESSVGTVDYASDYTLSRSYGVYAYDTTSGNRIAIAANWNYELIPATTDYVDTNYGECELKVSPVTNRSIHKINLDKRDKCESDYYKIENDFVFVQETDTTTEKVDYYNYISSYSGGSVEDYVEDYLSDDALSYAEGQCYTNNLANKLFVNTAAENISDDNKTLTDSSTSDWWIYLQNRAEIETLPQIVFEEEDPHKMILCWTNGSKYFGDEDACSNYVDIDIISAWSVGDGDDFEAHYIYLMDFYYEDRNSSDGVYSKVSRWYQENTAMTVSTTDPSQPDYLVPDPTYLVPYTEFKGWVVRTGVAKDQGYAVDGEGTDTLTLTKDNGKTTTTFTLDGDYITSVKGNCVFDQNSENPNSENPIVVARLHQTQIETTVNLNHTYWSGLGEAENYDTIDEQTNDDKTQGLIIVESAGDDKAYGFVDNNNYHAFTNEITTGQVDVFNYGFDLTGYIITASSTDNNDVCYVYNGSAWVEAATETQSEISNLTKTNLQELLTLINSKYQDQPVTMTLTLNAQWEEAQIKLMNGDSVVQAKVDGLEAYGDTVTYSKTYELSRAAGVYAYKTTEGEKYIVINAIWNYYQIPSDAYTFEDDVYKLDVEPLSLELICSVALNRPDKGYYEILNSDNFQFSTENTKQDYYDYFSCDNKLNDAETTYEDYNFVEDYVEFLALGEINGRYETFYSNFVGKVFVDSGTISDGNKLTGDANWWIYLINNAETGTLPQISFGSSDPNRRIFCWTNGSEYFGQNNNFTADISSIMTYWNVDYGVTFEPYYIYAMDFYYEDRNSNDGVYSKLTQGWYQEKTAMAVSTTAPSQPDDLVPDMDFIGWVVRTDVATSDDYLEPGKKYDVENGANTLTLIKDKNQPTEIKITFNLDGDGCITSVQGTGVLEQVPSNPIVVARLHQTQINVTFEIGENDYWSESKFNISNNYGTIGTITAFKSGSDGFAIGSAFKRYANAGAFTSGVYAFKYGFDLTGYTVKDNKNVSYNYYYNYESDKGWETGSTESTISNLTNTKLQELLALINERYQDQPGAITLTFTAQWKEAEITLKTSDDSWNNTVTYSQEYTLSASVLSSVGQEIFVLKQGENYIALNGCWNYNNLPVDGEYGNYSITVTPHCLNNIYRVQLNDVRKSATNTYKLEVADYTFKESEGVLESDGVLKWNNYSTDLTGYSAQNSNTLVDDYIYDLKAVEEKWNEKINCNGSDHFNLFKKVYYTDDNDAETKASEYELQSGLETLSWYIYLANGQNTWNLPEFIYPNGINILWKNDNNYVSNPTGEDANKYVYKTASFVAAEHSDELKDAANKVYLWRGNRDVNNLASATIENNWYLSDGCVVDGDGNVTASITAHYFRKYITVSVETLFDSIKTEAIVEKDMARRGYVYIDINDNEVLYEDCSADYVMIYNNSDGVKQMQLYKVGSSFSSLLYYVNGDGEIAAELVESATSFKVFFGCTMTLNVKDQSKDSTAMATGFFDDMIGYKYKNMISYKNNVQEEGTPKTGFSLTLAADEVRACGHKTELKYEVYFEEIKYDLTFAIDENTAGDFKLRSNSSSQTITGSSYKLQGLYVGNIYSVDYLAFAGYTLKNNAFTLNDHTLQEYNETAGKINQQYILTAGEDDNKLNGTWLRENYYSVESNERTNYSYADTTTDMGILQINTDKIEFTYKIKIYDDKQGELDSELGKYIIKEIDKLTDLKVGDSVDAVGLSLTAVPDAANPEFYKLVLTEDYAGDYALLSSRLYFPNSVDGSTANKYKTYDFLLKTVPSETITLTSAEIASMVKSYEQYKIIPSDDRVIYSMLEIRKLITVTVQAKYVEGDSNDTTRKITISNGSNNSAILTLTAGDPIQTSGTYSDQVIINSYQGLENVLTVAYDSTRYSGVKFYKGVNAVDSNRISVDNDETIYIQFIPKMLKVEFKYTLDGTDAALSDLSGIISETTKPTGSYYKGQSVEYKVEVTNSDYSVEVKINNVSKGSTTSSITMLDLTGTDAYTVVAYDYSRRKIEISVNVSKMASETISIEMGPLNSDKHVDGDDFGTYKVISEFGGAPIELTPNTGTTNVYNIVEGRTIKVALTLNEGFKFGGYRHGASDLQGQEIDDSEFVLIPSYQMGIDSGVYYILIDKENVTAELDISGTEADSKFFMNEQLMNGENRLEGLYVGLDITFNAETADQERLDYFYYEIDDVEYPIEDDKITITSELLKQFEGTGLTFKVKVVKRYNVTFEMVGREYLAEDGLKAFYNETEEYLSGMFVDNGTIVKLNVTAKDYSVLNAKYNISVQLKDMLNNVTNEQTADIINNFEIGLTENYNCIITITPKEYAVNVSESHYRTLNDVDNNTPTIVTGTDCVNGLVASGQTYKSDANLTIVRATDNVELSKIIIKDNDMNDVKNNVNGFEAEYKLECLIVEFDGLTSVVKAKYVTLDTAIDENDRVQYVEVVDIREFGYEYEIVDGGEKVQLTYVTLNNISVSLEYKDYKIIKK